jgi:hypothetical protein
MSLKTNKAKEKTMKAKITMRQALVFIMATLLAANTYSQDSNVPALTEAYAQVLLVSGQVVSSFDDSKNNNWSDWIKNNRDPFVESNRFCALTLPAKLGKAFYMIYELRYLNRRYIIFERKFSFINSEINYYFFDVTGTDIRCPPDNVGRNIRLSKIPVR